MLIINRRRMLQATSAFGATAAFVSPALLERARAWAQEMPFQLEDGATLRMLRWSRFVESEAVAFDELLAAFSQATGVPVELDSESFEDLRPKAAVAANVGAGPDIIWGIHADAHLYPDAMLDVSDVADHLGGKYGGWYDSAEFYGLRDGKWITLPFVFSGNLINYRQSMVQAAGFEVFPDNTDDMLLLAQKLKENGTPMGFALGNASGDGNAWTHWLIWSHGGQMVDADNNVVINSPETIESLKYVKELSKNFVAGAGSWLDANNNKAFLGGDVSVTNNGISIYAAAQAEGMDEIANDMQHAAYPIGPVGKRTELHVLFPFMLYNYTPYPNAAKALVTWLMEKDQYNKFLEASVGYLSHTLPAYNDNPVWTEDPKRTPFRDVAEVNIPFSHAGDLGYAASSVFADFVVVNMVAEAASGTKTPEEAAADAQARAERYYRV